MISTNKLFGTFFSIAVIMIALGAIVKLKSEIVFTFKLIPILFIALITLWIGVRLLLKFWHYLQVHYLSTKL